MEIVEVAAGTFACLNGKTTANAGFVATRRGVVVVDTLDSPARGRELAEAIRWRTGRPAMLVVNTHHHYDHVLGNQAFDAPVVAHCALAEQLAQAVARDLAPDDLTDWVAEHPEDRWLVDELEVVYPAILFEQRLVLDFPPKRMVLRHTGGHTPESSIVELPEEGVVFAGDLLFEGRVPFLRQAHFRGTIAALRLLEQLGARVFVPGHGELCDAAYVRRTRDYFEALTEALAALIAAGRNKAEAVASERLPRWWTDDRPDLLRANVERAFDELAGEAGAD